MQDDARQKYIDYVTDLVGTEAPAAKATPSSNIAEQHPGFEVTKDGKLQTIKINKPEKKNAISRPMYKSMVKVALHFF